MKCGDTTIDGLITTEGAAVRPLCSGDHAPAVGYLHDLLRGHGYGFVPDPRADSYYTFGSATSLAVENFARKKKLVPRDEAGGALLRELITQPAPKAVLGGAYVPLVLDVPFTPILRFVWLTSVFETGGAFEKVNRNTDGCGVSMGILQWSQKAGQLHRFLKACADREPEEWRRIMPDQSILDYTARPDGGVDALGIAADPAFDLTNDPWRTRLELLGASAPMQRVQLALASDVYQTELHKVKGWARAMVSERAQAFLLDLANQFGAVRVEQQYVKAAKPGVSERAILRAMTEAFVAIARLRFQPQVRARREFFMATKLLSDM